MMQTVFVDMNLKCVQLQQTGLKKKNEMRHLENSFVCDCPIFDIQLSVNHEIHIITIHQIAYTSKS